MTDEHHEPTTEQPMPATSDERGELDPGFPCDDPNGRFDESRLKE